MNDYSFELLKSHKRNLKIATSILGASVITSVAAPCAIEYFDDPTRYLGLNSDRAATLTNLENQERNLARVISQANDFRTQVTNSLGQFTRYTSEVPNISALVSSYDDLGKKIVQEVDDKIKKDKGRLGKIIIEKGNNYDNAALARRDVGRSIATNIFCGAIIIGAISIGMSLDTYSSYRGLKKRIREQQL